METKWHAWYNKNGGVGSYKGVVRVQGDENDSAVCGDYIAVRALENGVTIIGMTRGRDTRLHHTEHLDAGEVMIAQFTDNTSAVKVRGRAEILTRHGRIRSGLD